MATSTTEIYRLLKKIYDHLSQIEPAWFAIPPSHDPQLDLSSINQRLDELIAEDFATATKQDTLIAKDYATETTLASVLSQLADNISGNYHYLFQSHLNTTNTFPTKFNTMNDHLSNIETVDFATATKQDTLITQTDQVENLLTDIKSNTAETGGQSLGDLLVIIKNILDTGNLLAIKTNTASIDTNTDQIESKLDTLNTTISESRPYYLQYQWRYDLKYSCTIAGSLKVEISTTSNLLIESIRWNNNTATSKNINIRIYDTQGSSIIVDELGAYTLTASGQYQYPNNVSAAQLSNRMKNVRGSEVISYEVSGLAINDIVEFNLRAYTIDSAVTVTKTVGGSGTFIETIQNNDVIAP